MLTVSDFKFVIQCVPQRAGLICRITDFLPGCDVNVNYALHEEECLETAERVFREASQYDCKWVIRFEDDAILCPDFLKQSLRLMNCLPDSIQFASLYNGRRLKPGETYPDKPMWEVRSGSRFMMSQCIVFTPDFSDKIANNLAEWNIRKDHPHPGGQDICMAECLKKHRLRYAVAFPGLVQHDLDVPSFLGHNKHPNRRSPSFDYWTE